MDTIFPSRLFERLRKSREPEKRLMAAILEDAVQVYRDHMSPRTKGDRQLLREVEAWFASNDALYPFSFLRISHELGIDPRWFRQVLARWRAYRDALGTDLPRIERLAS